MNTKQYIAKLVSDDCWKIIFTFLPLKDHVNLGNTCKWLNKVSTHPYSFAADYKHKLLPHHIKYLSRCYARVKNINVDVRITDKGLVHLKSLVNLQSLGLGNCKRITDRGLVHLKSLVNLQILNLTWCNITSEGLIHLQSLVNLRTLLLFFCDVHHRGRDPIRNMLLRSTWVLKSLVNLHIYR